MHLHVDDGGARMQHWSLAYIETHTKFKLGSLTYQVFKVGLLIITVL